MNSDWYNLDMPEPKYWDRRSLNPDEAVAVMRSHGLNPLDPYLNAKTPWRCLCMVTGKETSPTIDKVKSKGRHVCVWCAHNPPIDPEAATARMWASQLEPLVPYPGGNNIPWLCRCTLCGSDTKPLYLNIQQRGHQCMTCKSGKITAKRLTPADTATHDMKKADLDPQEPFVAANAPWKCLCRRCGKVSSRSLTGVRRGKGCTRCGGFNPVAPGMVYLCVHDDLGALKVGVGSPTNVRLTEHKRHGWRTVFTIPVAGGAALGIEKSVLDWWRNDLGLPPYLSARQMPQKGWTETIDLDAVSLPDAIDRIRTLARNATCQRPDLS